MKHLMLYREGYACTLPLHCHEHGNVMACSTGWQNRWHPQDARLSVEELQDMVGQAGMAFSNRVLHFGMSLHGSSCTQSYWFRQRSKLIAMVDSQGLPPVFFTHSTADLQWPELAQLLCPNDASNRSSRNRAVIENPVIADWFFYERIQQFLNDFYNVHRSTGCLMHFEWQHRGSPHVHDLAWIKDAPDVHLAITSADASDTAQEEIVRYIDSVVSTAVLPDGSNAPLPQTDPHVCNKPYVAVDNHQLLELVATCQRHTHCSPMYCL